MRRYVCCFLLATAAFALGLLVAIAMPVGAQAPDHLTATPVRAGYPQAWMPAPFCVATWWDGVQCSEHKGDELRIGAGWKLDLPTPAWLTLVGRRTDGVWLLSAVAKVNEQPPAPGYVAVDGPALVQVVTNEPVTPSPLPSSPTATAVGPTATGEATPTPLAPTVTPTHPITPITPTPMFPQFPTCTTQILIYRAGDPATGGLGGKVGSVSWCGSCNSGCGIWMFGVDERTMDGWTDDANERVHELWATVTVEARR